jgi:hypothetical protein
MKSLKTNLLITVATLVFSSMPLLAQEAVPIEEEVRENRKAVKHQKLAEWYRCEIKWITANYPAGDERKAELTFARSIFQNTQLIINAWCGCDEEIAPLLPISRCDTGEIAK